ncbi:MAG: leucine-rich repeat domain-containing protein [Clostridia bacterium]|nr:leucine-rich repeat domain-containing protein [Clostridia bacterium]
MTKKIIALLLATLMLCALVACSGKEDSITDDPVINIGVQLMTYTDTNGDTFTYEYLTSTTVKITAYSGNDEPHTITVPAKIEAYDVTAIDEQAFYACSNISSLVLPEGLIEIGAYAFANCEVLTEVSLPKTLEKVGKGAFYDCDTLPAMDFSKTALASIGENAFAGCVAMTTVTFPSTLRSIEKAAFLNCTALTAITLPEGVASVGEQAFYNCTAAESLTLPASLVEIGNFAFNPTARDLESTAITAPAGSFAAEYLNAAR